MHTCAICNEDIAPRQSYWIVDGDYHHAGGCFSQKMGLRFHNRDDLFIPLDEDE